MSGYSEYRNEQFIKQYEHITKLKLLTNEELSQVKKKRNYFEVSIRNSNEIKSFMDYIKFELALMRKFKQIDYEIENDGRALDKVMAYHVKDLFRMSLKKFQDKRKIWAHYLEFVKQKFQNSVTPIYREMLRYHHEVDDYIEAAGYEMSKDNFTVAMSVLTQGMGIHKESSKPLVVLYIQCSLKQGELHDESAKTATLLQAAKFYEMFLKNSEVEIVCELLKKIQDYKYSMNLQNTIITDLITNQADEAEVWDLLAARHLDGLVYKPTTSIAIEPTTEEAQVIPMDIRLRYAIAIYEKSLDAVSEVNKKKMFEYFINCLLKLDEVRNASANCLKITRQSLGKTLVRGFDEGNLSEHHFILLLQLRMLNMESNAKLIEEMIEKGQDLHSSSMGFFELAIKFYLQTKSFEKIGAIFKTVIASKPNSAIELYRFLCGIYLNESSEKDKARNVMLEAINSSNKQLSEAFQPYYLEYVAFTESLEKAREAFKLLLQTRTVNSLSLDFFKMMIKLEDAEEKPNDKNISNCYERATEHFGRQNSEIWLDYIRHLWKRGRYNEADEMKKRAMTNLSGDIKMFEKFEKEFTMLRNNVGMEVDD